MASQRAKNLIRLAIKLAIAGGLLYLLFRKTGAKWSDLKGAFAQIGNHWGWFTIAILLHIPGYILQALRWGGLLRAQKMSVPMPSLLESYVVATFFNNILLGSFGGDVIRAYDTGFRDKKGKGAEAAAVVLVDRISGLVVLMFMGVLGMFFVDWSKLNVAGQKSPVPYLVITAVAFFGVIVGIIVMLRPAVAQWVLGHIRGRGKIGAKVHAVLEKVYNALIVYADKKAALLMALFWGLLHGINVVIHYYILAITLGLDVNFWRDIWGFFIAVPVIQVISAIPLTPSGHGTGDAAHVMLKPLLRATTAAQAIAIRWTFIATTLVWAFIGFLVFLLRMVRGRPLFGPVQTPAPAAAAETT